MQKSKQIKRTPQKTVIRYVLPLGLAGLLIGMLGMWLKHDPQIDTVSDVTRQIYDIALARGGDSGKPFGGAVGPWWISAEGTDYLSGDLTGFSLTSGDLHLGARRATVWVDPTDNTFSLQLHNVVILSAPTKNDVDPSFLQNIDEYVLGPATWQRDIVSDDQLANTPLTVTGVELADF
jgi:hypothetical protein